MNPIQDLQVNIALEKTISDLIDLHGAQKIVNTALAIQAKRARKAEDEYYRQRDALRDASSPPPSLPGLSSYDFSRLTGKTIDNRPGTQTHQLANWGKQGGDKP